MRTSNAYLTLIQDGASSWLVDIEWEGLHITDLPISNADDDNECTFRTIQWVKKNADGLMAMQRALKADGRLATHELFMDGPWPELRPMRPSVEPVEQRAMGRG